MKLILAPPGAGKTRYLVEKINEMLASGISPFRILATTFSREGAHELSKRLGGDVPVRTVHSLALWVVRVAARARGERIPRVIPAEGALALMERVLLAVAETAESVKFFEPTQALTEIAGVRERGGSLSTLHPTLRKVADQYFKILGEEGLIDFTGILERARIELANPDLQEFVSGMSILVDEGQDLNPYTEWPVLDGFRQVAEEFILMASPSQQIYGFKGADWEKLAASFPPDTDLAYLEHNYRSTPEIIEASRSLAGSDARHMRAVRDSLQHPVVAASCQDEGLELDFIGQTVARWKASGIALHEMAILTRAHSLQNPIQRMLRERDIPYSLVGERPDFYQREEIQAAVGYLELALEPRHEALLERIINYPPAGIGVRMRYTLRGEGSLTWKHLIDAIEHQEDYPPQVIGRLRKLIAFRNGSGEVIQANETLVHKVGRLLALTEIPDYLNSEGDFQGIQALNELAKSAMEFETLQKFCAFLDGEIQRPRSSDGIQLSTLHAAKGREWQAVILPNFQDGVIPLRKMNAAEERNLAFVGLTRARDLLTMTLSRQNRPSPFLNGMAMEERQWP